MVFTIKPTQKCKAVANYIINQIYNYNKVKALRNQVHLTPKRLQKLLYFCEIEYMKEHEGKYLFEDEYLAWPSGPVIESVYFVYRQYVNKIFMPSVDINLTDGEKKIIDRVLERTCESDTSELVKMTQIKNGPWHNVYTDEAPEYKQVISKKDIFSFYCDQEEKAETDLAKITTIYGVKTSDDEMSSSIKVYCLTRDIALREAKKYSDFFSSIPAGEKNIVPIEVIVE